jgi:hypothetical protein
MANVFGTSTGLFSGMENTWIIFLSTTGNNAARLCIGFVVLDISGELIDDWFLPSKDELDLMYQYLHLNGFGNFINHRYWSSSRGITGAWQQNFATGAQSDAVEGAFPVRPVRAF